MSLHNPEYGAVGPKFEDAEELVANYYRNLLQRAETQTNNEMLLDVAHVSVAGLAKVAVENTHYQSEGAHDVARV